MSDMLPPTGLPCCTTQSWSCPFCSQGISLSAVHLRAHAGVHAAMCCHEVWSQPSGYQCQQQCVQLVLPFAVVFCVRLVMTTMLGTSPQAEGVISGYHAALLPCTPTGSQQMWREMQAWLQKRCCWGGQLCTWHRAGQKQPQQLPCAAAS